MANDLDNLIDAGRPGLEALRECLEATEGRHAPGTATALANVRLLAPIPRPRKNIFGIGLNYVEHVAESAASLDEVQRLRTTSPKATSKLVTVGG